MRNAMMTLLVFSVFAWNGLSIARAEDRPPIVEKYLIAGELAKGEAALVAHLKTNPHDDEARFGLGTLQFIRGVERLAQSLYRYGVRNHGNAIPLLRLPVDKNPNPEPISYAEFRAVFQTLAADLTRAEATLAEIHDTRVKLRLHFGQIRLDLDGDGKASEKETLWRVYAALNRRAGVTSQAAQDFVISFDKADVHWLRGYCHLLLALDEMLLAHDCKELFERAGHVLFSNVESPYDFRKNGRGIWDVGSGVDIADLIAFIHLINLPCKEPKRMQAALDHLNEVVAQSRLTWKAIEAESDDDREWIPGPKQTGVIPNVRVSREMIDGWHEFLDEAEAILAGKKLVPHWRIGDGRSINLHRVFTEPKRFDLVLWIQGTDAEPYLERGKATSPDMWRRLQRTFQGQFIGFAIWFN